MAVVAFTRLSKKTLKPMVTQTQIKKKLLYFPITVKEWSKMAKNLTHAQLKVLGYVRAACGPWGDREVEVCVKDMAQELGLDRSTVGRALKYLATEKLIDMTLVRVGVRVAATALAGFSERDRTIASCDRSAQPCDRTIASGDSAIASTIYSYDQLFNSETAGEKNFAGSGSHAESTAGTLASLINRLETLFRNNNLGQDQFSAQATGGTGGAAETNGMSARAQATGGTGGAAETNGMSARAQATGGTGGAAETNGVSARAQATGGTGGAAETNGVSTRAQATGGTGGAANTSSYQKEVWEVAPGKPDPVFLAWRAKTKYEPQGGHWANDALGNAYAEFYNNPAKTGAVLFPQFMEYMQVLAQNGHQQQFSGGEFLLPSLFKALPAPSEENLQQLIANVEHLVAGGARVALPQATPSCQQSISLAEAISSRIAPLPDLQLAQPTLPHSGPSLADTVQYQRALWRNAPVLRGKIVEWANATAGVELGDDGPVLVC